MTIRRRSKENCQLDPEGGSQSCWISVKGRYGQSLTIGDWYSQAYYETGTVRLPSSATKKVKRLNALGLLYLWQCLFSDTIP